MVDYGIETVFYRQAELTGTKFRSVWKADLILIPFILICSITFANFIWSMAAIPSPAYPFTEKIWEFNAMQQTLIYSSTAGERQFSQFRQALNGWYILSGGVIGVIGYGLLAALSLPVTLFFGFVRGINNQTVPHTVLTGFLGACLGRFYFQRKLGKSWRMYIPVVLAGFSCGMGLISMLCIGLTFLSKAVFTLSY
jgi:hypothetical protein